ncbi:MAG: DUF547 domain-containing protein [Actinomycetota bacterium]
MDHSHLGDILTRLEGNPLERLPRVDTELSGYLESMTRIDPDDLAPPDALAFWMNVYNAAALRLAASAARAGVGSVLGLPGAFTQPAVSVAGEDLSLDGIEHGKIRRFRDPRIHAGLVCGSASCPSLPRRPFGGDIEDRLDERMRRFLHDGAMRLSPGSGEIALSPVFSWFGGDFTRPHNMPTLVPAPRRSVLRALTRWLDAGTSEWIVHARPRVRWDRYDWRLGCAVG